MVAILILNWNGWRDTIECLESLSLIDYKDYIIFLGDNGSTDNSKDKISDYCRQNGHISDWKYVGEKMVSLSGQRIILFDLLNNNGFAKGNNMLIAEASKYKPDYYLLLNNDTEVDSSFLSNIVSYQKKNPSVKVLTPVIYYFDDKNKIWNAGGNLFWGIRKYHFPDEYKPTINETEFIACSFITGCALFCTPDVLMDNGKIFTEDFFHGEEDFDFSLRMKKQGIYMGCIPVSKIYHKVGSSSGKLGDKIGLTYCYYLNRFINLRHHLNIVSFYTFILIYFPYVVRLLKSKGVTIWAAVGFYWKVVKESHRIEGVSYDKFIHCVRNEQL